MNYYDLLDLQAEPFSTSPDPAFLYRSPGHLRCLHTLEIAVRLRRGLCVVLGEVGTGKTTLCRELLEVFSRDRTIKVHLLMDPQASSAQQFLERLYRMLYSEEPEGLDEVQLKEEIKKALLAANTVMNAVVVLVIDEGQKLAPHSLEVLRELLNYETNTHKLLQIIIFSQNELYPVLQAMPNLADRINDMIRLQPLSFRETVALIEFRLDQVKTTYQRPVTFTKRAYRLIYAITRGYPRHIVRLCHKVMLALASNELSTADAATVQQCLRDDETVPLAPLPVPVVSLALAASLILIIASVWQLVILPESRLASTMSTIEQTGVEATQMMQVPSALASPQPSSLQSFPETHSTPRSQPVSNITLSTLSDFITVQEKDTLFSLMEVVYGTFTSELVDAVARANPAIDNVHALHVGQKIRFPLSRNFATAAWWAELGQAATLSQAFILWRTLPSSVRGRIVPCRDMTGRQYFAILYKGPQASASKAQALLKALPPHQARLASGKILVSPTAQE